DGAGPHQLTSTSEGASFSHDALGRRRQLHSGGEVTSWTSFDLPREILSGSQRFRFGYDAFGQRVVKDGPEDSIVYLGDLFESHKTGEHVFRVFNEHRAIAEIVELNGARRTRYLHDDHLGSTAAITDENGNVLQRVFHDPFGRRHATQVDGETPMGPLSLRGFTSHEHDDDLDLINMRGRMYDPATGRFLTPDPLIRSTLSSQALNPYSYVENRPLSFVDPTGYKGDNPGSGPAPATPESPANPVNGLVILPDEPAAQASDTSNPSPARDSQPPIWYSIEPSVPRPSPASTTPAESAPTVRPGPPSRPLSYIGPGNGAPLVESRRARRERQDRLYQSGSAVVHDSPGTWNFAAGLLNRAIDMTALGPLRPLVMERDIVAVIEDETGVDTGIDRYSIEYGVFTRGFSLQDGLLAALAPAMGRPSLTPRGGPTRFIHNVRVVDRRTGRVFQGTVDLKPTLDRIASGAR
ncbi:hypothetical protein ARNL5_01648, partial [Anaerolineae bacterium]